jgi:hypothetical protein
MNPCERVLFAPHFPREFSGLILSGNLGLRLLYADESQFVREAEFAILHRHLVDGRFVPSGT